MAPRRLPTDSRTRWNSTQEVITFATFHKDAFARMTELAALHNYKLTKDEWDALEDLSVLLMVRCK